MRWACWGLALLLSGCFVERSGTRADAGPRRDGGMGPRDAATPDTGTPDAAVPDTGTPEVDAAGVSECPPADDDTLALYSFDGDEGGLTLRDVAGAHDGSALTGVSFVDGPPGCGRALAFGTGTDVAHGSVPDSDDWDLDLGSIDFWVRVPGLPSMPASASILSRDAMGDSLPGHLSVWVTEDGRIAVRVQGSDDAERCSDAVVPFGRWFHVGVNFGGPDLELWVDGAQASSARGTTIRLSSGVLPIACDERGTSGIAGNDNPWTFGTGTLRSTEGSEAPLDQPFRGGAIDHVRISQTRRDFARP